MGFLRHLVDDIKQGLGIAADAVLPGDQSNLHRPVQQSRPAPQAAPQAQQNPNVVRQIGQASGFAQAHPQAPAPTPIQPIHVAPPPMAVNHLVDQINAHTGAGNGQPAHTQDLSQIKVAAPPNILPSKAAVTNFAHDPLNATITKGVNIALAHPKEVSDIAHATPVLGDALRFNEEHPDGGSELDFLKAITGSGYRNAPTGFVGRTLGGAAATFTPTMKIDNPVANVLINADPNAPTKAFAMQYDEAKSPVDKAVATGGIFLDALGGLGALHGTDVAATDVGDAAAQAHAKATEALAKAVEATKSATENLNEGGFIRIPGEGDAKITPDQTTHVNDLARNSKTVDEFSANLKESGVHVPADTVLSFYKAVQDELHLEQEIQLRNPNLNIKPSDSVETKRIALENIKQQESKAIQDTGDKMFGSRKDLAKLDTIGTDELVRLESENGGRVAEKMVTKQRILGPEARYIPDTANGNPALENLRKLLIDSIPGKPADSAAARQFYVERMPTLVESLKSATTPAELKQIAAEFLGTDYRTAVQIKRAMGARFYNAFNFNSAAVRKAFWRPPTDFSWVETAKKGAPVRTSTESLHGGIPVAYDRSGGPQIGKMSIKQIKEDFGLKGIELGNYVKDAEAMDHLARFAEGMADLEQIVGFDVSKLDEQMGLGVGFGSRGAGGKAIAHYEPATTVINISKKSGADGSLAHEWGHALDDFLTGKNKGRGKYASDKAAENPAIADAMRRVMAAIKEGKSVDTITADGAPRTGSSWGSVDYYIEQHPNDPQTALNAILERYKGNSVSSNTKVAQYIMAKTGASTLDIPRPHSEFYGAAIGKGDYWKRPTELFARAFSDYTRVKGNELGIANNYLNHTERVHPLFNHDNPAALVPAMDHLMTTIKQVYGLPDPAVREVPELAAHPVVAETPPMEIKPITVEDPLAEQTPAQPVDKPAISESNQVNIGPDVSAAKIKPHVQNMHDFAKEGGNLITTADGKVAGWLHQSEDGVLDAIEIKPEFQRQGIAENAVRQLAADNGGSLKVFLPTEDGTKLFNSIGDLHVNEHGEGTLTVKPKSDLVKADAKPLDEKPAEDLIKEEVNDNGKSVEHQYIEELVHQTGQTPDQLRATVAKARTQLIRDELGNMVAELRNGKVEQGGVGKNAEGEVTTRFGRFSTNPEWYKQLYREHGTSKKSIESAIANARPGSAAYKRLEEIAISRLNGDYTDPMTGPMPKNERFIGANRALKGIDEYKADSPVRQSTEEEQMRALGLDPSKLMTNEEMRNNGMLPLEIDGKVTQEFDPLTQEIHQKMPVRNTPETPVLSDEHMDFPDKAPMDIKRPKVKLVRPKNEKALVKGFASIRTIIKRQGEYGQELASRLIATRQAHQQLGQAFRDAVPSVMKLKDAGDFHNFVDTVEGRAVPRNAKVVAAVNEWQAVVKHVEEIARDANVPMGHIEDYFPHTYDKNFFTNEKTFNAAVEHLVNSGQATDIHNAVQQINDMREPWQGGHRYGNLEKARQADIPGYKMDRSVVVNYLDKAAKRIAETQHLGLDNEHVDRLIGEMAKDGKDANAAQIAFNSYWHTPDNGVVAKAAGAVRKTTSILQLSKAAISHSMQSGNAAIVTGNLRTAEAWMRAALSPEDRAFVHKIGINYESHNRGDLSPVAPGLKRMRAINRTVSAIAGRDFGNALARKGKIEKLRRWGVQGDIAIDEATGRHVLSEEQQIHMAHAVADATQYSDDHLDLPTWGRTPTGKLIGQYRMSYQYKQGGFIFDHILKEAGRGNLLPAMRALAVIPIGGLVVTGIKHALGAKTPQDPVDKYLSIVEAGGGGNIPLSLYASTRYMYDGPSTVKGIAGDVAPLLGTGVQTVQNIQKAIAGKPKYIEKQGLGYIPFVGALVANHVFPASDATPEAIAYAEGYKKTHDSLEGSKDQAIFDAIYGSNKDDNGNKIPPVYNPDAYPAIAQELLAHPKVLEAATAFFSEFSDATGQKVDPLYETNYLTGAQQIVALQLRAASAFPGELSSDKKVLKTQLPPDYDSRLSAYYDSIPPSDNPTDPNKPIAPAQSAQVKQDFANGNTKTDAVKEYLAALGQYNNQKRAMMGLPQIAAYGIAATDGQIQNPASPYANKDIYGNKVASTSGKGGRKKGSGKIAIKKGKTSLKVAKASKIKGLPAVKGVKQAKIAKAPKIKGAKVAMIKLKKPKKINFNAVA
jgi:hypothetical protein